jgi:ureidoacrylate peracid hydrolase
MMTLGERFDPRRTALIVIDVQNDFCHPDGACVRAVKPDLTDIKNAMPHLKRLLAAARDAGLFVVFIRSLYDDEYLSPAMVEQYGRRGYHKILQSGTWGAKFFQVNPMSERGEIIVTKHRYCAFSGTSLDHELKERRIDSVICCGFTTSTCVESTARDALFRDFHTAVARDAVAEYDRDLHHSTLKLINRSFGLVPSVDEIVAAWKPPLSRATSR